MVKLRDPLSQVLEDAEDNDVFVPLDVGDLPEFRVVRELKKPRRRAVRRKK